VVKKSKPKVSIAPARTRHLKPMRSGVVKKKARPELFPIDGPVPGQGNKFEWSEEQNDYVLTIEIDEEGLKTKESWLPKDQAKRQDHLADYSQLPVHSLARTARRFTKGEGVYGRDNWKKGGLDYRKDSLNHAIEHLMNYAAILYNGEICNQDDNLAAVAWFCMTEMEHQRNDWN